MKSLFYHISAPKSARPLPGGLPILAAAITLLLLLAACGDSQTPEAVIPTPDVPPLEEIDAAISLWESGHNTDYFVEVEETTPEGKYLVRVVVVDDQVWAAQRLENIAGEWQPVRAMPLDEAEAYTVDALLARVRADAIGEGPAPMNMLAVFDPISGFPSVVETRPLPSRNEAGSLQLNREYAYTLGASVGVLIEEMTGLGREPIMVLTRSGGEAAWCDNLRVFEDGTSVYADNCRQTLLQLRPPGDSLQFLQEFSAANATLDQFEQESGGEIHLLILGSGVADADAQQVETAWAEALELAEVLSKPIGAGVTMLYQDGDALFGFDMRTMLAQPATLGAREPLHGVRAHPDSSYIAFADDSGLRNLEISSGNTGLFFSNRQGGHFLPREWGSSGHLVVQQVNADGSLEWGWTSLDDTSWQPLALKNGFSCDAGISLSPAGPSMVIAAGLPDCDADLGLVLVGLEDGGMRQLVDASILVAGQEASRGAHDPAWSPQGDWIAVTLDEDGQAPAALPGRVYLLAPDGSDLQVLTENTQGRASHPLWAPDAGRLFYSMQAAEIGDDGIYAYDFESGAHTLLLAGSDLEPVSVSPTGEFLVFDNPDGLNVLILSHGQVIPVASADGETRPVFSGWLLATQQ